MTRRLGLSFEELTVGAVFLAIAVLACLSPAQADTFWALRAGEDILAAGRVPLIDTYSSTAAGRPWPNHEWLSQAGLFLAHRAGGFPLATAGAAALVMGAYAVAYRLMGGPARLRFLALIAGIIGGANAWALRPHLFSLLLMAVLLWLLVREREVWIPPLFVLWANLHGGVVLGGVVLGAVTAAAWIWNRPRFGRLLITTALSGGATALTPMGPGLWTFVLHWAATASETGVSEWRAALPVEVEGLVFWLLALGFLALLARAWRRTRGEPWAWADRLLVVATLIALPFAARSIRNVAPFVLIAMPAATRLAMLAAPNLSTQAATKGAESPRLNVAILAALAVMGVVTVGVAWTRPLPLLGWQPMSPTARAAIAACPDPLYNGYNDGGVLIWFVKEKPVFIDGRHDPYERTFLIEDRLVETGAADFRGLFQRHGIRCAALSAGASLAARLEQAGWRRRFADAQWLVLEPGP
jgi:hypothetical protein